MEEESSYSTVVFKNGGPAPKGTKEDHTIYSEVKLKGPATVPDGEAAAHPDFRVLAVCLGILCVFLAASVSAIIYIMVVMTEQKENIWNLTASNQQLIVERNILKNETEELSSVTAKLNWTLGVIRTFNTFPVNEFCPNKKCQPCQKDWIQFGEKCYLFYNNQAPWKTWGQSRQYCEDTAADLAVIDSLQEQEFMSNHTEYYYDKFHGYWFGLNKTGAKNWTWVDGRNDTLGYWIREDVTPNKCAMMIPQKVPTASWEPANCEMQNRFICEREVLKWSN